MAVQVQIGARATSLATQRKAQIQAQKYFIKYLRNGELSEATKLDPAEFSAAHLQTLNTATLTADRELIFGNPHWHSFRLGAGEEKTVFMVVDEAQRAFALELLVRGGYLNGHLAEGHYLADLRLSEIAGLKREPKAMLSLVYSGEVRVREFIYGDTLVSSSRSLPQPKGSILKSLFDGLGRWWARQVIFTRYQEIQRIYKDAHEANVIIELIPLHNPERKSHYLLPIPALACDNRLRWYFYRLTPIDVRALPR